MAVKYYCDGCGVEIQAASKINPTKIATIEVIDAATGTTSSEMLCGVCVPKLKTFMATLKPKE